MNETLSSSIWPNFPNSRPNWSDQFSSNSINTWQHNNSASDFYQTPVDFNNVWSIKSEINDDGDKDSYIKSIWSTSTSPTHLVSENPITISEIPKPLDNTPTNSPSINRSDLIVSNERWGNIKINQTTPWMVSEIDEAEKRLLDPMVWRAKIDGTEVWEEYYTKQHGKRRPQPADNGFGSTEHVWSSGSTDLLSQQQQQSASSSLWSNKSSSEITTTIQLQMQQQQQNSDIFGSTNFYGNGNNNNNNHSNFNSTNGVRPSMTRIQAQKYLQEMGFSLSDSIGALVNNQMDLPKALNELQSKYRNQSLPAPLPSFSTRQNAGDPVNISRMPPSTPVNNNCQSLMMGGQQQQQGASMMAAAAAAAAVGSGFPGSIDSMFHSDMAVDQMLDSSKYMIGLDSGGFSAPRQRQIPAMQRPQESSFRNAGFPVGLGLSMGLGGPRALGSASGCNSSNGGGGGGGSNGGGAGGGAGGPSHAQVDMAMFNQAAVARMNMGFGMGPPMPQQHSAGGGGGGGGGNGIGGMRMAPANGPGNGGGASNNNNNGNNGNGHYQCSVTSTNGNGLSGGHTFSGAMSPAKVFSRALSKPSMFSSLSMGSGGGGPVGSVGNGNGGGGGGNWQNSSGIASGDPAAAAASSSSLLLSGTTQQQQPAGNQSAACNQSASARVGGGGGSGGGGGLALPDISQLRLAKHMSCVAPPSMNPDKVVAIVIKKVQHHHIDVIKSACMESGAMINFHLNPQAQSIIVQFANVQEAYRYSKMIQNNLFLRVDLISSHDEYMHYMSGAN